MDLRSVVKLLDNYGNLSYASQSDNVGLLVEPDGVEIVWRILLTNELTEAVLTEALKLNVNLIITYHPVISAPLYRLTQQHWRERVIVRCIENRIAVYSPHTVWDLISTGIDDWIMKAFNTANIEAILPSKCVELPFTLKVALNISVETDHKSRIVEAVKVLDAIQFIGEQS